MADNEPATQLHPQLRFEVSGFNFHQQNESESEIKQPKMNDNGAGETSSWLGKALSE
jgi:hypothetical protein